MEQKKESSSGVLIYYLDPEPKFLLLKYKTYWGFAKGAIESGESIQEAALREVKEETNLDVKIIPGFEHKQEWFYKFNNQLISKTAIFFIAKITKEESRNAKISFEHEDFKFLGYEEAIKLMKIKQNKEMLKKAREFIQEYESQKRLV